MNDLLPSFYDELEKISKSKTKLKLSGEETVDTDNASRTLEAATKAMPWGKVRFES